MPVRWTKPAVDDLQAFTSRGRPGRMRDTRELIISGLPFVIIYRIREASVEIIRVIHGAQKWP